MANPQIRKRLLEEKLGLKQNDIIKSGFDQETVSIVWDIVNEEYESLLNHPLIKQDEATWTDWVFFLVVHNTHASIWAIEEKHLRTVSVIEQNCFTAYDVSDCLKSTSIVHRFHAVIRSDDRYYVKTDELNFRGKQPEFDICIYVGTFTFSLRGLKVVMAMIAKDNNLRSQSDCLDYCKDFVMTYFDITKKNLRPEDLVQEQLKVITNALSAASERSGQQNQTSGWSLRSFLISTISQISLVYIGTVLGGVSLYFLHKAVKKKD